MTGTWAWDRGKGWKCTCASIMHTVQPNTKICLWYTHIRELISYFQHEENECRITPAGEPRSHTAMNDLACCNWWPWVYRISWRAKKQDPLITRAWIFLLPPFVFVVFTRVHCLQVCQHVLLLTQCIAVAVIPLTITDTWGHPPSAQV